MNPNDTNIERRIPVIKSSPFESGFGPITDKVINDMLTKLGSDTVRQSIIDKLVDPMTDVINDRIQPYIHISIALYSILITLMLIVIYLLVQKYRK